ncbi:MAG TPA: sigma factor [Polyangia bacterium]|nr:sigma factor [Polyangia bacterium]
MGEDLQTGPSREEMLVRCIPSVASFVRRQMKDQQEVEEVVQEVCLRALAGDPPGNLASFSRWCCGIARHVVAREWIRRRRARRELPLDEGLADPTPLPDRAVAARGVLVAAVGADVQGLQLLSRRYLFHASSDELARELGLTSAAVRMRLSRLRSSARARHAGT